MNSSIRIFALAALFGAVSAVASNAQVTLTSGDILGVEASGSPILVKYSPVGTVLQTLALTSNNPAHFGVIDGLTIIGSNAYTVGTGRGVARIDLNTGFLTTLFIVSAGSVEGLGKRGNNLLVAQYSSNTIQEYSIAGSLLNTIALPGGTGITGVDSDGTNFYVASYSTGDILILDASGNLLNSFATGLGSSSLSGLGYDKGSNTIWVSSCFGSDEILHFSSMGTLLSRFSTGLPFIDSLEVIPTVSTTVAEPGAVSLIVSMIVMGGCSLRRRARK